MLNNLTAYWRLMRFDKPIGILLLLWPTLWALWLAAQGQPNIKYIFIFTFGTILMRAAGCVINDYADRHFDAHVARTRYRPLATGEIKPLHALILFVILCAMAFILVLFLNTFTLVLSIVAVLLTIIYPFTKRFFFAPQLILPFSWAVPMAFAAVLNHLPFIAWELYTATLLWIIIYDTEYAMVDREDDLRLPIHSTAILFGKADRLMIGILQFIFLGLMILIGQQLHLAAVYYFSLSVAAGLFAYQQWLISKREPSKCFKAFINNQWVGLVIFLGIWISLL